MDIIRCYSELSQLKTFFERYEYLKLDGQVGIETFGFNRYLNQAFYQSNAWKEARRIVIERDLGCDLGIPGREIHRHIVIHHMNPISEEDIFNRNPDIYNPEFLISCLDLTHRAIHYSDESLLYHEPIVRSANDTCPWRL